MPSNNDDLYSLLKQCPRISVLTGAGISAESGVPTFRGREGAWSKFKPEELAHIDAFMSHPELVWEWYQWRLKIIREVKPNFGHYALVEMAQYAKSFYLVTQNVDNLHQRAGQQDVIELHGSIEKNFCTQCQQPHGPIEIKPIRECGMPRCRCGGLLRPGVVWFGETIPAQILAQAELAAQNCDLFLSVGTSGVVYPAAGLPQMAREAGAFVVEINMEPTEISLVMNETILGLSGKVLPKLAQIMSHCDPSSSN